MKISDVMTRDVKTVRPDQTAREAATFMFCVVAGAILVTDGERLMGVITDRDIAVRGVAEGRGPDTPVSELMTNDLVTVGLDDDVDQVAARNSESQVRRLTVVDDQRKLCGIVSLADLTRGNSDASAKQALDGVSQPGGRHQQ